MSIRETSVADDDKLEFHVFSSILQMGLARSSRVAQAKGPFIIWFHEPVEDEVLSTYFQVDGEYFKADNLERIEIRLHEKYGRMRILSNIENET